MKFVVLVCILGAASAYYHEDDHQRYHGPKHYPIITKHGVPLETPEVREARLHHHIAHEAASYGYGGHLYSDHHGGYYAGSHGYGDEEYHRYHGPKHYPIITKHGVPLETPEVIEAKIHHEIAHETAAHGLYHGSGYGHGHDYGYKYHGPEHYPIITKSGVPLDTPAVRDAKIHHHIAHEVAAHESGHYY